MDKKKSLLLVSAVAIGTVVYNLVKPVRSTVKVVEDFDVERFLGKWFEIARLDFYWEKNLKNVSAVYTLLPNLDIRVENKGEDIKTGKRKKKIGKAKLTGKSTEGALKVSFFGPFYSGYNIKEIDDDYKFALIYGDNLDYLWILSRSKTVPDQIKERFLTTARESGYAIEKLVWTVHD